MNLSFGLKRLSSRGKRKLILEESAFTGILNVTFHVVMIQYFWLIFDDKAGSKSLCFNKKTFNNFIWSWIGFWSCPTEREGWRRLIATSFIAEFIYFNAYDFFHCHMQLCTPFIQTTSQRRLLLDRATHFPHILMQAIAPVRTGCILSWCVLGTWPGMIISDSIYTCFAGLWIIMPSIRRRKIILLFPDQIWRYLQ